MGKPQKMSEKPGKTLDFSKPLRIIKQEKFVQEYLTNGGNASLAYTSAGYRAKEKFISSMACQLLKRQSIQGRILAINQKAAKKTGISRSEYIDALVQKARNGSREEIQLKAWEMLAKSLGYNEPDKLEVAHNFPDFLTSPERYVAIAVAAGQTAPQ